MRWRKQTANLELFFSVYLQELLESLARFSSLHRAPRKDVGQGKGYICPGLRCKKSEHRIMVLGKMA